MSWLTKFSLRNRSVVALVVIGILILGAIAINQLRQELIPSIELPALTIFTVQAGSSPADVERSITIPLETALNSVAGVKELDSYSNANASIIVAQYEYGTDMQKATADVQGIVDRVTPQLPSGSQPEVAAINFSDFPVMQLAVSSDLPADQLAGLLQTKVVPQLQQIPGVIDVSLSGVQGRQIQIELQPEKLAQYGVSAQAVLAALRAANVSMPAGNVTTQGTIVPVRVTSSAVGLDALSKLPVQSAGPAAASAAGAAGGTSAMGDAGASGMPGAAAGSAAGATTGAASGASADTTAAAAAAAKPVTLGDVAKLSVVPTPVTSLTRTNGKPSVGISITKSADGNVVDISRDVNKLLPSVQKDLGSGTTIVAVVDQAPYITKSISSMWREGLLGALFALIVILIFLQSWRATVVAGISIPLSVIMALIVLWGRGDSLNMLTLAGLTIAIGRVIDDSIVVLENSYRHLQEGQSVMGAAYNGTREVSTAITASTLTTVAVFLPLGFVQGVASEFFRPFALTVTFALLSSLLVAVTVVPVAFTWLFKRNKVGQRDKAELSLLQKAYVPPLQWALRHKAITLGAALLMFVGTMALTPLLKTNLLDSSDQTTLVITQTLPPGTETAKTAEAAKKVEDVLAKTEGVGTYQVVVGSTGSLFGTGGGTNAGPSVAQYSVDTTKDRPKGQTTEELRKNLTALPGAGEITVSEGQGFAGDNSVIEVRVYADDPKVLSVANAAVMKKLTEVKGLTNLTSNLSQAQPQIGIAVDPTKAATAGLDATQVGQFVGLVLNGMPAGNLITEQGPLPAVVSLPKTSAATTAGNTSSTTATATAGAAGATASTDASAAAAAAAAAGAAGAQALANLPVFTSSGLVPLGQVATVTETKEPVQVTHTDGQRTVTISASDDTGNVGQTSNQVKKALEGVTLPAGARWEVAGASEQMAEAFSSLGIAMAIAILLVYLIMVATFRSLLDPLILLVSIPFAAVGAVILLLITGTSLGMASLIGLLMLIGIVVTNAIVLLDLIEQFRRRGLDAETAVVEGARRRLRPILMTAIATILALTPMALGLGEGSFLSKPLAVVVIGGLVSSTALTLIIVPVLYMTFERFRRRRPELDIDEGAAIPLEDDLYRAPAQPSLEQPAGA